MSKEWSNLAKIVYARTYSRELENGAKETWEQTVDRVVEGNIGAYRGTGLLDDNEEERLKYFLLHRKAMPAGRGLWFSGADRQKDLKASALTNCYVLNSEDWNNFPLAMDLLMLGGGVGMTVEHKYTSKLPRIKRNVVITNKETNDADFIVPDSREGWVKLLKRVLKSYFETGESFSYSCILIRGRGEVIKGFGGKASGKVPLIDFITKLAKLLDAKAGKRLHPIDVADIVCMIGEVVVAGNNRRSAILIQGDPFDKEFLKAKRWDLGMYPSYRAMANFSVNCNDVDDLHPLFWKTYEHGEPFGIVNIDLANKYGRIGELKKDNAIAANPCAEQLLPNYGACNLTELVLGNMDSEEELYEAARLMYRYAKRVSLEGYIQKPLDDEVIRSRRVGVGITGCLQSYLFNKDTLDKAYKIIQEEDKKYSKELGVNESIRLTTTKPSGSISLVADVTAGIHPAYSEYYIRRVRFDAGDSLIDRLKEAGHYIEPAENFPDTLVVDFPCRSPKGTPVADKDWGIEKQLEVVTNSTQWWSDSAVSVTVYYKKDEIPFIKEWLRDNIGKVKSISFLCHSEHGFKQAPYEAITKEQYDMLNSKISPIDFSDISLGSLESMECEGGACPVK